MPNPPLIVGLLVDGTVGTVVLIVVAFLISRFTPHIVGRSLLVIALFTAAGVYVVFAVRAGAGPFWLVVELVHVGIFGTMGLLGLRGSPYWLATEWALRPL